MRRQKLSDKPEDTLTKVELQLVCMISNGMSNKEIADSIGRTVNVTKNLIRPVYEKTGMESRTQLALWYIRKFEHANIEKVNL